AQVAAAGQTVARPGLRHYFSADGLVHAMHPLWNAAHVAAQSAAGPVPTPADYLADAELQAGINPHPLFDSAWIRRRQGRAIGLAEYLADPALRFISTHPLFDGPYYRQQALACGEAIEGPALLHYLERGWWQGYQPNRLFDGTAYLAAHPELARSGQNPLLHYLSEAGRSPAHWLWDAAWVEAQSPGFTLADY